MVKDRKPQKAEVVGKARDLMREGNRLIRTAEILLQGCRSPLAAKAGKISGEVDDLARDLHDAFMRQLSADMKSEIKNAAKEYARKRA